MLSKKQKEDIAKQERYKLIKEGFDPNLGEVDASSIVPKSNVNDYGRSTGQLAKIVEGAKLLMKVDPNIGAIAADGSLSVGMAWEEAPPEIIQKLEALGWYKDNWGGVSFYTGT